jgi:hypothetical protein
VAPVGKSSLNFEFRRKTMALALAVIDVQAGGTQTTTYIAVTPSANYVVGGDTADLTKATNPNFIAHPIPSRVPIIPPGIYLEEMGGVYTGVITSATLAGLKIKFYTGGGAEFAAATYASQAVTLANFNGVGGMQLVISITWKTGT